MDIEDKTRLQALKEQAFTALGKDAVSSWVPDHSGMFTTWTRSIESFKTEGKNMTIDLTTINPGDTVVFRNGGKSTVKEIKHHYCSQYYVYFKEYPGIIIFHKNGNFDLCDLLSPFDIIEIIKPVKKVLEGWVNVYSDGNIGNLFATKKTADTYISNRIACIHIRQEYVEGEGL